MNYYEKFLKFLKEYERAYAYTEGKAAELDLFKHLIELMGEERFNFVYKYHFIDQDNIEDGFFDFHKSMRQADFYSEYFRAIPNTEVITRVGKRPEYENIGGHLDMIFWNFIHMSERPFEWIKEFTEKVKNGKITA